MKFNVIDRVENKTLAKLDRNEIGALGLCNEGVGLYRGDLKTRYNGMKRQTNDGVTFWFEAESVRIEFTEIAPVENEDARQWAARIYVFDNEEKTEGHYQTYPMGITGCGYFR